ncbi:MAG: hypothetical protein ICV51_18235 [Flavisolibacter sp.]|nr:hypothetical protein [Flavisolibacter sp.]MBD0377553.1 hypothetical protein [Flavisolibacter sp.]
MRKKSFCGMFALLLCLLMYNKSSAQASLVPNCYMTYKSKGDTYNNQKNYNSALQQYQYAKNCSYLTNVQRVEIDNLIAQMKKLQGQTSQKQTVTTPAENVKRVITTKKN